MGSEIAVMVQVSPEQGAGVVPKHHVCLHRLFTLSLLKQHLKWRHKTECNGVKGCVLGMIAELWPCLKRLLV